MNEYNEYGGLTFLVIVFFIVGFCFMINAIMRYAERNGRNKTSWMFIAIIFTPILSSFLLFLYGETKERRKERIIEEELWKRKSYDDKQTTTS